MYPLPLADSRCYGVAVLELTDNPSSTSSAPDRRRVRALAASSRPLGAARLGFAIVTAALLLAEIALTRVFSGTIGYYFAFMSISVAMLGLGAGSLWVTLRGVAPGADAHVRAGHAALGLGVSGAIAMHIF